MVGLETSTKLSEAICVINKLIPVADIYFYLESYITDHLQHLIEVSFPIIMSENHWIDFLCFLSWIYYINQQRK